MKKRKLDTVGLNFNARDRDDRSFMVEPGDLFFLTCCTCGATHLVCIEPANKKWLRVWMHLVDADVKWRKQK